MRTFKSRTSTAWSWTWPISCPSSRGSSHAVSDDKPCVKCSGSCRVAVSSSDQTNEQFADVLCPQWRSCSGIASCFVLGQFVIDHIILSAFDPLHVAIAKKNVAPGGAMVVVSIRIIINGPGSLAIPIHDQPYLGGANNLASQSEHGVFVRVAGSILIRFLDAAAEGFFSKIPMAGRGDAIVVHKAINLVADAAEFVASAMRLLSLEEHVSQNGPPVERVYGGVGGDEIIRCGADKYLPADSGRNVVRIKPGQIIVHVAVSAGKVAVRIIVGKHLKTNAYLLQVTDAGDLLCCVLCSRQSGQQQTGEDREDRDHDQQFNQGERIPPDRVRRWRSSKRLFGCQTWRCGVAAWKGQTPSGGFANGLQVTRDSRFLRRSHDSGTDY